MFSGAEAGHSLEAVGGGDRPQYTLGLAGVVSVQRVKELSLLFPQDRPDRVGSLTEPGGQSRAGGTQPVWHTKSYNNALKIQCVHISTFPLLLHASWTTQSLRTGRLKLDIDCICFACVT